MLSSLSVYTKAISLVFQNKGLKRYAAIPVLINLWLYSTIIASIVRQLYTWEPNIPNISPDLNWIAWINPFLDNIAAVAKWIFGLPLIFFISYFTFVFSCLVIASPFNDILSEKTETILTGNRKKPLGQTSQLLMMTRSILFTSKILLKQLFWSLLVLPLLLIPYIGFLPLLLVTAYFTGIALVDIPMNRHNWKSVQKKSWLRQSKYRIIGLGIIAELSFLLPLLPLFVFPLGVVAGTILYCQDEKSDNNYRIP